MLTNKPRSFYKRLPSKKIIYRYYKMFDEAIFLHDKDQEMINDSFYQHGETFAVFYWFLEMWLIETHL